LGILAGLGARGLPALYERSWQDVPTAATGPVVGTARDFASRERERSTHVTDDADTRILNAALAIRSELGALVPGDATPIRAALDDLLERAKSAFGQERSEIVDEILSLLTAHEPTRMRLRELDEVRDTERGAAADVWSPDQILAGSILDDGQLIEITCQACGYINRLAFRPPADDPPDCQNQASPHPLVLA
jgi:hypothetical protein